ncbi:MAG: deoxyribodipyrimidine photo-lyase [Candidatus Viridilinea halotolerans]|uniref:Deoxyribodipyrimidine photo-lyase n=1 Tax=Candidatus Viridilinea halotolerans TaxID=2491704 RepID=A0A426U5X6_9CHLR|nr:MAG: deoxyribodipyrimidine photo-lyase [Candidatus Viridilinea halotolerans]
MAPIIHWFRRDLRLADNSALAAAAHAAGGAVLPVFIFDPALLRGRFASAPRTAWLLAHLHALAAQLAAQGSRLVIRRGAPVAELVALAHSVGARAVYWNVDDTPYARERDRVATNELQALGLEVARFKDVVVLARDEVLKPDGTPYTVFTPYARRWRERLAAQPVVLQPAPRLVALTVWPPAQPMPTLAELGLPATRVPLPAAGETAALERLHQFAAPGASGLAHYANQRDMLAASGTSRLSPDLRLGSLSVRVALQAALAQETHATPEVRQSLTSWVNELIWREFYTQILYHFPHVLRGAFRQAYDLLPWENDAAQFHAWQTGQTGYPVVDAAMRQLQEEGWMHNRARMIVASFLSKDLLIDWRWGERHFMHLLLDGDPASNNGGWQWAAGTGTDAQPYFRIFNPTTQGQKFDPEGDYVRRYLPVLARVPARYIHTPHLLPPAEQLRAQVQIGRDYPLPIVDHKVQRARALALFRR